MKDNYDTFKFSPSVILWPLAAILTLWAVYWLEVRFHIYLTEYGILPRTFTGLRGIIFSPFLHGSLEHLYNNSIPLFLLIAAMRYFYRRYALQIIMYGILLSGFITWLIGRGGSYHIGASGLIYVLVSFVFFKGIQTGYYRLVAVSMTIILLYGGMVWYVFPGSDASISWEGHLGGLISGLFFTRIYDAPEYQKPIVYDWQRPGFDPKSDPFMRRFDVNGNFVNLPRPEDIEVIDPEIVIIERAAAAMQQPGINIVYTYVASPKEGQEDIDSKNII